MMAPYPPPAGGGTPPAPMPPPGYPPPFYPQPGYPPYPGMMPPPKSNIGKVIVIVVGVLVVVFVVLPVVLFFLIVGLQPLQPVPPPQPTLVLNQGPWNDGNLTITITSVANAASVNPADLAYFVQSADGTTYFSGPPGRGSSVSGTVVTVTFGDNVGVGQVSAGDSIRLTVEPSSSDQIRGGTLWVFFQGNAIGTTTIT